MLPNNNNYNCSILTYDHNTDEWSDGLSINGYDGVSICTGSNTRNERMRITSNGSVGIGNSSPCAPLNIGSLDASSIQCAVWFSWFWT
jgi:hypothetical protein